MEQSELDFGNAFRRDFELLFDLALQLFAGSEERYNFRCNFDRALGLGIDAAARFASANRKFSESDQFDLVTLQQGLLN